jgi:HSP20 family protein
MSEDPPPMGPFALMQREMGRFFTEFFGRPPGFFGVQAWSPPMDVLETPECYVVRLELAGAREQDFDVSLTGLTLQISGRRDHPPREQGANFLRAEIFHGSFQRDVELPGPVEEKQVAAAYKDGYLEVRLPKKGDARPRTVQVPIDKEGRP